MAQKTRWHHSPIPRNGDGASAVNVTLARLDQVLNGPVVYEDGDVTFTGLVSFTGGLVTINPGPLVVGVDPGGSEILRVGGGATFNGNVRIATLGATDGLSISRPTSTVAGINFATAGSNRWGIYVTETAESGGDAGSNFRLRARTDAGVFLDDPMTIVRAAGGTIQFNRDVTLAVRLVFATAVGKILMGATSLSIRDSADTGSLFSVSSSGQASVAGANAEVVLNPRGGGGAAWELYAQTTAAFRVYHSGDQFIFNDTEVSPAGAGGKTLGTAALPWGDVRSSGILYLSAAVAKIVPGATSLSHRNAADSADNLLIADNGTVTLRNSVQLTAGILAMDLAVSKIRPGATSLSLRNNADSADNILISDAGAVTFRGALAGATTLSLGGPITLTTATSKIIPGATALQIRNTGDTLTRLSINSVGAVQLFCDDDTLGLTLNAGTVTGAGTTGFVQFAGTWNTSGAPVAFRFVVTETAAGANALLADFVNAGSRFNIHKSGEIRIGGDAGGVAAMIAVTNTSDLTGNSSGVGTIKFKGTTSRDSSGFIKFYIGTTAYYIPVFAAITG